MISLEIYGDPVPWARPGFYRKGGFIGVYNTQKKLQEGYQWQLKSQYRDNPIGCPLLVCLIFYMPIPASTSGVRRRQMLNGIIHHDKKPDVDNLQKFVLDALNKIVIKDDSQIIDLRGRKVYSEKPGTTIRIIPYTLDIFKRMLIEHELEKEV